MTRVTSTAIRHAIALTGNPQNLIGGLCKGIDPYQAGSSMLLEAALDNAAQHAWARVKETFSGASEVRALENSWAAVAHMPEWTALLYRGALLSGSDHTVHRAEELASISKQEWHSFPFVSVVAFRSRVDRTDGKAVGPCCPDLIRFDGVEPITRLRYGFAHVVGSGGGWPQLFEAAALVPEVRVRNRIQLLMEAAQYVNAAADRPLTLYEVATLSRPALELFACSEALLPRLCPGELQTQELSGPLARNFGASYRRSIDQLKKIAELLATMQWSRAGRLVARLQFSQALEFAVDDSQALLTEATRLLDGSEGLGPTSWRPMSAAQAELLNKLFKREIVKKHWTLSAEFIGKAICLSKYRNSDFSRAELALLGQTWSLALQRAIVQSGKSEFLSASARVWDRLPIDTVIELAAARAVDGSLILFEQLQREVTADKTLKALLRLGSRDAARLVEAATNAIAADRSERRRGLYGIERDAIPVSPTWGDWIAPDLGRPIWLKAVEAGIIAGASPEQVMFVWLVCPDNEKTKRFQQCAVKVLSDRNTASPDFAIALVEQILRSPASADYIVPAMSAPIAKIVAELEPDKLDGVVLRELVQKCNSDQLQMFWEKQLERARQAQDIEDLLLLGIKKGFEIKWSNRWTQVSGTARERARALSLIACRYPSRIRKLKSKYGEANMAAGMLEAAKLLLPYRTGDAVQLELMAALGPRHAPSIQWILMKRDRAGAKGCRLDALYESYEIPKKSGAMRTISAPHATLKRVQRSILVNLLNPLGAHASAHGFVNGRSILTNAQCHVGKPVVVNADVGSCFPSVKWPLVLAALKRDLSDKYSAQTISALTDICTANGALPIGAPTSPALLNRVLLKTDEILSAKANERGCSYSRYADDITFSGDDRAVKLLGLATGVIKRIGLELDPKKTNIFRRGRRQMCTGLVVNDKVSIPRKLRRNLRAALHAMDSGNKPTWMGKTVGASVIRGWLEYLRMIDPDSAASLIAKFDRLEEE